MQGMGVGRSSLGGCWTSRPPGRTLKYINFTDLLSESDWVRNDKWTAVMEAASFGQAEVKSVPLAC